MIEILKLRDSEKAVSTEKESNGVVFWGDDNKYPYFLNRLYNESPIHSGIINSKVNRIISQGLQLSKEVDNNGGYTYSVNEIIERIVKDFELSNLFYIKIIKLGESKIFDTVPYEDVRVGRDGNFLISKDWGNSRIKPEKISNYFKNPNDDTTLIQFSELASKYLLDNGLLSGNNYATPTYAGGITAILSSIEIVDFNYYELMNSFKGGALVSLNNGEPQTEEEKDKILKDVRRQATSKNKQGGLVVVMSKDKEHEPTVSMLNGNNLPARYNQTETATIQNIMLAHSVSSPEIFGLIVSGSLGGNSTREESEEAFFENYTKRRRKFLENALNFVLNSIMQLGVDATFKDVEKKQVETTELKKQVDEATVIEMFEKFGRKIDPKRIVNSYSFDGKGLDLHKELKKEYFALTEIDRNVLALVTQGDDFDSISKALDIRPDKLVEVYQKLQLNKMLDENFSPTALGVVNSVDQEIEILYNYDLRPDAPDLKKGGKSREFCTKLMANQRYFTRQEIDTITAATGMKDVWLYRGGWYSNPKTERNEPACRHEWRQNIVLK